MFRITSCVPDSMGCGLTVMFISTGSTGVDRVDILGMQQVAVGLHVHRIWSATGHHGHVLAVFGCGW